MTRCIVLVCSLSFATFAQAAEEGIVEAVGEAQIKDGDKVAAKREATAAALRGCIEKVVGIYIESDFSVVQKETVKGNKNEFEAKVRDSVVQKASGFIQKYDVLDEKVKGDVLQVRVKAHVFESKVKAELRSLADLIAAAGNPKLMVIIQEVTVDEAKVSTIAPESVFAAYLEKELIARGFELRGQKVAARAAADNAAGFEAWLGNQEAIAKLARDQGADIVIVGRIELRDLGRYSAEEVAGLTALAGQKKIELFGAVRGVNAASGEVFSSKAIQRKEIGTDFGRAVFRAFRGRGNLVDVVFAGLLDDAKESFKKIAKRGQSYVVKLNGVKSFRAEGQGFLTALGRIDGISEVKQKSFADGTLVVDLLCKCSTEELQQRIFAAAERDKALATLDIEGASGKQLSFKL